MNRNRIIIVVILVIVCVGSVILSLLSKDRTPAPLPPLKNDLPLPVPAALETEKIEAKYYDLDLEYPKNSRVALAEIGVYVEEVRSSFLESVPKTDEEAVYLGLNKGRTYVLNMKTDIYVTLETITYKLETYMDTGGAHGNTTVATFTYDNSGKLIILEDLLSSPDSFAKLSAAARAYFYKKLGAEEDKAVIDMGTEPKVDNFNTWYINDYGITFVFQQYQVGSYVTGIQEFPISRTEARGMLDL